MMNTRLVFSVCLLLWGATAQANLILNGDFETNSAVGTQFNRTNAEFNALVPNATAFGTSEEIDLVTGNGFGIAPQSGNWKVGLHETNDVPGKFDGFSLDLTSSILPGASYRLQFFAAEFPGSPSAAVQIGLSNNASNFGTLLFSGLPMSGSGWSQFVYDFTAVFGGAFLTVRNDPAAFDGYVFVDNLSVVTTSPVPEPSNLLLLGSAIIVSGVLCAQRIRGA